MFNKEKLLAVLFVLLIGNFIDCNVQKNDVFSKQLFDLNWKFNYGNIISAYKTDFNDESWRNLDLPHDWSRDEELMKIISNNRNNSSTLDSGWYRKQFIIPDNWNNKILLIDFEGICSHSEIFLNGISIDNSGDEKTSFQTKLNPYLNTNGNNVIAIRVAIPREQDGIWSNDTGIYEHVWLVVKNAPGIKN